MNSTVKRTSILLAGVALISCSGSAPPRTQYLLRAEPAGDGVRVQAPLAVGMGRVTVAAYLSQSGIVVQTDAGQVHAARQHQWAEPLDAGLRSYLRAELSRALGYEVRSDRAERHRWDYAVEIHVDQLHGTMGGTAVIDASYRIVRIVRTVPDAAGADSIEYRFSSSIPLPRKGYPGVVDAEAALARELATAIAASLVELAG